MFRIFRKENKLVVKILHMAMQVFALACGGIGLKAVFRHHRRDNTPNMYSMHSWIGFPCYIMFGLQVSVLNNITKNSLTHILIFSFLFCLYL